MGDRPAWHQSEIEARAQAAALASDMLAGRSSYFEGARRMVGLRPEVGGANDFDPDFKAFEVIESETGHRPHDQQRALWSASARERLDPELERVQQWAADLAPEACRNILARFADPDS